MNILNGRHFKKLMAVCSLIFLTVFSMQNVLADDFIEDQTYIDIFSNNNTSYLGAEPPKIDAGAAMVLDVKSGRVIYEKNAYSERAIASTTKIMTAILAIENGNPDDIVTVSGNAAKIQGSTIGFKAGEQVKLEDLLYCLMLNSGNDAAIAIAEHLGGTVENFIAMMNGKAEEVGAGNTCFKTPHGLDETDHYSTAYDLALIARYAMANPIFAKIVGTTYYTTQKGSIRNTNEMLGWYPGADGVKTGYTGKAGRCLVTSVSKDGWRIISVVLNCPSRTARAQSTKKILDYAFNNYKLYTLQETGKNIKMLPVIKGIEKDVPVQAVGNVILPLRPDEMDALDIRVEIPDRVRAPVYAGVKIGSIMYMVNDAALAWSPLETGAYVGRKDFAYYLEEILKSCKQWRRDF